MGGPSPIRLMDQIVPTGQPFAIAARMSGPAKTAFPKGPPAAPKKPDARREASPPVKPATAAQHPPKAINVVVMADSDMFDDRFWVRVQTAYGRQVAAPFADNGAFVLNAVENLTGSGDLISLRTRATSDRPFTVVKKLQAQAQAQIPAAAASAAAKAHRHAAAPARAAAGRRRAERQCAQGFPPSSSVRSMRFQREVVDTRAKLRDVQHNLRKNIDALGDMARLREYRAGAAAGGAVRDRVWRCCAAAAAPGRLRSRMASDGTELCAIPAAADLRFLPALPCAADPVCRVVGAVAPDRTARAANISRRSSSPTCRIRCATSRTSMSRRRHGSFDVVFKPGKGWVIASRNRTIPASFAEVNRTVVGLASARRRSSPKPRAPTGFTISASMRPPKGDGVLIR